jgi:hypothetical protein
LHSPSTAGIAQVEIFNNNIPLKSIDLNDVVSYSGTVQLPLMFGANNLKLTAISRDGKRSLSHYLVLRRRIEKNSLAKRKRHVVLIGIDNYEGTSFHNLNLAVTDCEKIGDLLHNYSNTIAEENIIVHKLFNDAVNLTAINTLFDSLQNTDINDEVVILLAGHGSLKNEFEFVIPSKTGPIYWSYSQIIQSIGKLNAARKLLLLDACHSGLGLASPEFDSKAVDLYFKLFFNYSLPNGVQVISSAYSTQKAKDGYFVDSIEKVLLEMDGEMTVSEFFNNLKQKNEFNSGSNQKFTFTNTNPMIQWKLFSSRR